MCFLELRDMWKGRGNCVLALGQLVFCPLTSLLTHLYSIFTPRWRERAMLQKTIEGFLCAGDKIEPSLTLFIPLE